MDPRYALKAKRSQDRRLRTPSKNNVIVADSSLGDPDKARVMTYCGELVAIGYAEWDRLENGSILLRLNTGEIYLLESATVTRIS